MSIHLELCGTVLDEYETINRLLNTEHNHIKHVHWTYSRPGIVLGRGQKLSNDMIQRAKLKHVDIVQRATGGGAVLAMSNLLSVTTIIPKKHPLFELDFIELFQYFGRIWQSIISDFGIVSQVVKHANSPPESINWICFASTSYGELTDKKGRKLLGIAQSRRTKNVAISTGLYVTPIDWHTLFDVFVGQYTQQSLKEIKFMTTSFKEVKDNMTDFDRRVVKSLLDKQLYGYLSNANL